MSSITKVEAATRAHQISSVRYQIHWDFTAPGASFTTTTVVRFSAHGDTFLDLVGEVASVRVNGSTVTPEAQGDRLMLRGLTGETEIHVATRHAYRNDGQGIHRFIDPEDGRTYLYSQFAANDARQAFPCFDQPDIKATFAITVDAPTDWVVVSNSPTPEPQLLTPRDGVGEATAARWAFSRTALLPCYIVAVIAGPYAKAEGTLRSVKGELSAAVYGRANLADHLDAEEMLAVTQHGLDLFERVFDIPYPYDKYDQIFVPEYNLGAMENAGCVTFSEDRLLFHSRPSRALQEMRANIVLHELSHQWFGNLVTMQWWDDLWLNESFAEFMGFWATAQMPQWPDAWVTFTAERKSIAYVQDQLPTTHAIVTEIPDTEATVSAFDMITYAKGASALRQLVAYVGEEAFFAGASAYLKRYAWGNATLAQFLGELKRVADTDLAAWARMWLETPGPSTVRPVVESSAGTLTSLSIAQDVPEAFPVHRPHRLVVSGFAQNADAGFERVWELPVTAEGPLTAVPEAVGLPAPDLLLVNDGDLTYAKMHLDPRSVDTVRNHIGDLREPMAVSLVLDALWHMVRDAMLPSAVYADAVVAALPHLTVSIVTEAHLDNVAKAITRYTPPSAAKELAARIAEAVWQVVAHAEAGSDLQLQALKGYARLISTRKQSDRLRALVNGTATLADLSVDTDLKWTLLTGMAMAGGADESDIGAMLVTDPGAIGVRRAAGVRASLAGTDAKAAAWRALAHPEGKDLPNAVQYEVALGLARVVDAAALVPLVPVILDELSEYYARNEGFVGARVARYVFPIWAAGRVDGLEESLGLWLDGHPHAPSVLRKIVIESRDEVRRALLAQRVG